MRLQVLNEEEMAWQHGSGASPAPCGTCTRHEPDPFVTLWRDYSIKAPGRTSECKSRVWLDGPNRLEQTQHLASEPGTHPENARKDPKAAGRKSALDPAARGMLHKPAAFLPRHCSSVCRGERFLQDLMVGRNLQGQTARPHPVSSKQHFIFSPPFLNQLLFNTNPSLNPPQSQGLLQPATAPPTSQQSSLKPVLTA